MSALESISATTSLQDWFAPFRRNIIGIDQEFESPCGTQRIVYADWTASGRMYGPVSYTHLTLPTLYSV